MQWDYLEAQLTFIIRPKPNFDKIFKYNYRSGGFNIFCYRVPCMWFKGSEASVQKYHAFCEYYADRNQICLSWNLGLGCLKFYKCQLQG